METPPQVATSSFSQSSNELCSQEIPRAGDKDRNDIKIQKLVANEKFQGLSAKIDSTPEDLAADISEYFNEDEIDEYFIDGLENSEGPADSTLQQRFGPFSLKCNKARAGWALYQAQGWLVCAPAAWANPLAGLVCKVLKSAGSKAVDFNTLCD